MPKRALIRLLAEPAFAVAPQTPIAWLLSCAKLAMGKDQTFLAEWIRVGNIAASIVKAPKEAANILKKLSAP